jgi:hexosaminidase
MLGLLLSMMAAAASPMVWPLPGQLHTTMAGSGASVLGASVRILQVSPHTPPDAVVASALSRYTPILQNLTGPTGRPPHSARHDGAAEVTRVEVAVEPSTDSATLGLGTNYSYGLTLAEGGSAVQLRAASRFAVAHGLESLAQLYGKENRGSFSSFAVADEPTFPYRALMVDCGRRFVPVATLHEIIDGMAYSKMSVLNLHASEYGAFRIEIKAFPELTAGLGTAFYTQQDIKQLVQYAYLRGIRVVPQIDVVSSVSYVNLSHRCLLD